MAKKKKPPEHENLERWLVSYADFMTLIFATFVVLYALSQLDIGGFKELEKSIKQSFSTGIIDGTMGMMDADESLVGSFDTNSMVMMEYLSPKYEEQAYADIKKELEELAQNDADFKNISVTIDERGIVIKFTDTDMMFHSGSANLQPKAIKYLETVGKIIHNKFKVHLIRVEGHTDNQPVNSNIFPSNWELSSARASSIVRYFIKKFNFQPVLFSAVGLADNRPIADNATTAGRIMNRRVEIIILRNKFKKLEMGSSEALTQKILEIEHLKQQNVTSTKKSYQQTITPIDNFDIDIIPKNEIIVPENTYLKESQRIEKNRDINRKMFKGSD